MANQEIDYCIVGIRKEGATPSHWQIENALLGKGLPVTLVTPISKRDISPGFLEAQEISQELFQTVLDRIRDDLNNVYHPVFHCLEENGGKVPENILLGRSAVTKELLETVLNVFKGNVYRSPEDETIIVCPHFFPKEEISEGIQNP